MGTFQARVQSFLGSGYAETTNLSDNLTAGAKVIVDLLPENKLDKYAATLTDSGSGATVTGHRLIRAHKGGYRASRIDPGLKTQATPAGALSSVYIAVAGTGYALNDVVTLSQGTTGTCTITGVTATVPTSIEILNAGSAFTQGLKTTTVAPAGGSGLVIYVVPSTGSIYEPSTIDPSWYVENTKGYVLPGGGSIIGMAYPTVAYGDSTISNFPAELDHAVVLFAVIQGCLDIINDNRVALEALTYATLTAPTAPTDFSLTATAPTAPADSSYSYTDATLGTYTSTTIGSLGTAPTYTSPTTTIDGTIWATAYPNYATAIATALAAITTQLGNGVTAESSVAAQLGNAGTAMASSDTELDLAKLEIAKLSAEIILSKAEVAKAITEVGLVNAEVDKISAEIVLSNAEVAEAATNVDLAIDTATAAITTANGRINTAVALANTEFDKVSAIVDLANVEFDKIATKLATSSTTISTSEDLAKGREEYNQALTIGNNGETYLKEANERLANGNAYLEEARASYQEAQGYVSEVNARIQQVTGQIEVARGFLGTADGYLKSSQGYTTTVQGYLGTAKGYMDVSNGYAQTASSYISNANGYISEGRGYIDLARGYSESAASYINLAQGYATEVQARLANVNPKVSEYTVKMNDALNSYQKETELFRATTQQAIKQAELDQERLMLTANKTTDLSIQNKTQTLNAAIALYKDKLERFSGQINLFVASVGAEVQTFQQKIAKYQGQIQVYNAQIQDAQAKYSLDQNKYQTEINHFTLLLNGVKKEYEDFLKGRL